MRTKCKIVEIEELATESWVEKLWFRRAVVGSATGSTNLSPDHYRRWPGFEGETVNP